MISALFTHVSTFFPIFQDALRGVYLTSTVTEWLLALSVLTFTLTFAPNFKNMRVDDPRIYLESGYEVGSDCELKVTKYVCLILCFTPLPSD